MSFCPMAEKTSLSSRDQTRSACAGSSADLRFSCQRCATVRKVFPSSGFASASFSSGPCPQRTAPSPRSACRGRLLVRARGRHGTRAASPCLQSGISSATAWFHSAERAGMDLPRQQLVRSVAGPGILCLNLCQRHGGIAPFRYSAKISPHQIWLHVEGLGRMRTQITRNPLLSFGFSEKMRKRVEASGKGDGSGGGT